MQLSVSIQGAGYRDNKTLDHIHFKLQEGNLLAVIGPNGSGKTTLIRAISQVLPVIEGKIHINGTDLLQANITERAQLMAVVPQSTYVPPSFFVEEVVLMGRTPFLKWNGRATKEDLRKVNSAMHQTDIFQFKGQLCGKLSAGERQRVILARALAQDTPVLLMDEPTSHLDLRYQIEFLELVKNLNKDEGKTVVIAMHDLNLAARFGDLFLAMKDGGCTAFGKVEAVMQNDTLTSLYDLPIEIIDSGMSKPPLIFPK